MSLPVKVPHTQVQDWANHFFSFDLEWKKPRIKYSTLTISKEGGGTAPPNLREDYLCDDGYEAECKGVPMKATIGDHKAMTIYWEQLYLIYLKL